MDCPHLIILSDPEDIQIMRDLSSNLTENTIVALVIWEPLLHPLASSHPVYTDSRPSPLVGFFSLQHSLQQLLFGVSEDESCSFLVDVSESILPQHILAEVDEWQNCFHFFVEDG